MKKREKNSSNPNSPT